MREVKLEVATRRIDAFVSRAASEPSGPSHGPCGSRFPSDSRKQPSRGAAADGALLDDRYIAVSYHQDNAAFVVLDVESGTNQADDDERAFRLWISPELGTCLLYTS